MRPAKTPKDKGGAAVSMPQNSLVRLLARDRYGFWREDLKLVKPKENRKGVVPDVVDR